MRANHFPIITLMHAVCVLTACFAGFVVVAVRLVALVALLLVSVGGQATAAAADADVDATDATVVAADDACVADRRLGTRDQVDPLRPFDPSVDQLLLLHPRSRHGCHGCLQVGRMVGVGVRVRQQGSRRRSRSCRRRGGGKEARALAILVP